MYNKSNIVNMIRWWKYIEARTKYASWVKNISKCQEFSHCWKSAAIWCFLSLINWQIFFGIVGVPWTQNKLKTNLPKSYYTLCINWDIWQKLQSNSLFDGSLRITTIIPQNEVVRGRLIYFVRSSHVPCPPCNTYSSGGILSIFGRHDNCHERACRA